MNHSATPATPTTPDPHEDLDNWLWGRQHDTLFKLRLSAMYHLKRERYFHLVDKWCAMLTAVAATAAVTALLKRMDGVDIFVAGLTAVFALVPLVMTPSERARRHGLIAAEFRRLRADAERAGQRWTEAQCDAFAARTLDIEATEPAALSALVIDCQNQLVLASGQPEAAHPLRWHERWLMHVVDFDARRIVQRAARA